MSSGVGLVMGQVVLQNHLRTHLPDAAASGVLQALLDRTVEEVTALGHISGLPAEQQNLLREVLKVSLSRVWIMFTATAGACLLVSLLIKHHPMSAI